MKKNLYVEYHSEATGEPDFVISGRTYRYVRAKYPNGQVDLGIYCKETDMVMDYHQGRILLGIDAE